MLENEEGAILQPFIEHYKRVTESPGANSSFHLLRPFAKNKALTNEAAAVLTLGLITV